MPLLERLVQCQFTLGQGAFGTTGQNVVNPGVGLRTSTKIVKAGGNSMGQAQIDIYGLDQSIIKQLSTLGQSITNIRKNTVLVQAGDAVNGLGSVFLGTINNAWADFDQMPDVGFHIEASTGTIEAVAPCPVSSFTGSASVAVIMQNLATQAGLAFENNGVNAVLTNPYFYGSARQQILACAHDANINQIIDNGKLAIWPRGLARDGAIPLISKTTGMAGSPSFTSKGISVKTEFNPSIGYGQKIEIQSALEALQPANGIWVVYALVYDLDSVLPKGNWFATLEAARPGYAPIA